MIFDTKVITKSRKAHTCTMCYADIPQGMPYILAPHKGEDGFTNIKMCLECAYIMKHADINTFKFGNFTEQNIPNKLRKVRNEYRKNPIEAWDRIKGENDAN